MEALDSFNAHFSGALLALAESRLGDAFSEYRDLAEIAAGVAVPVPAQTNRRSTHGPGSAGRTSAPPQRENPIIEVNISTSM